ncbi:hypothetical protein DH2020_017120 [Rehmannia glutinosa]|uniref:Pectinesterase inhibitor domain-containing protein n=1 Tax=Rehmannia glutinosa TaxID=99300 RepID=A0ABR0WU86_REHGL
MAVSSTVPLLLTLTVLCCLLPTPLFLSAAAEKTQLAIEVCKNTTDFNFCRQSIYSDPRAPTADRVVLASITFTNAYFNATDTRDYIASQIKLIGGGGNPDIIKGLKSCLGNYNEAVRAINEVLGDLNDESYYDFDKLSLDAEKNLRACENGFHGRSPITQRNVVAIKLANICYVVSKLFQYND